MKPVHSQLPKGARIYLPDEAARKRYVEEGLLDVFARWGYREIVTPTFEFAEVLAMGTDVGVQESMFKFVDRETGRMLALRADITPQIARVVAGFATSHNITIDGGRGPTKGKIFRIGHMGYAAETDVIIALAALEQVLADLGQPVDFGASVRAAQKVFVEKS